MTDRDAGRYYQERSGELEAARNGQPAAEGALLPPELCAQVMLEELLALNRNLGNFLWTGFVTPITAYKPSDRFRFGADLLELVVEIEVGRLASPAYLGYARGRPDAEHILLGR